MAFKFLSTLLNTLLPQNCIICNNILEISSLDICSKCIKKINNYTIIKSLYENHKNLNGLIINEGFSLYKLQENSDIERLIYSLKYRGKKSIGKILGKQLAEQVNSIFKNNIDIIIPVPLHIKKLKERGYNQSLIIANEISQTISKPINCNTIIRHKNTNSQTTKNRIERYENLKGAFKVLDEDTIKNKNILIVDDVITTGATLESCGRELILNGAKSISYATLAKSI